MPAHSTLKEIDFQGSMTERALQLSYFERVEFGKAGFDL
jgi:hypothetical protein